MFDPEIPKFLTVCCVIAIIRTYIELVTTFKRGGLGWHWLDKDILIVFGVNIAAAGIVYLSFKSLFPFKKWTPVVVCGLTYPALLRNPAALAKQAVSLTGKLDLKDGFTSYYTWYSEIVKTCCQNVAIKVACDKAELARSIRTSLSVEDLTHCIQDHLAFHPLTEVRTKHGESLEKLAAMRGEWKHQRLAMLMIDVVPEKEIRKRIEEKAKLETL